jgi:hydrogenase maturation protease
MPQTLVIGYGNPLRGDDGLGWRVADCLAEVADQSTRILAVHQLTPELAEPIREADLVIFVDASYNGCPGSWRCDAITADTAAPATNSIGHHFTPEALLSYAAVVFQARPRSLLVSAAAESFDCGEKLTPKVESVAQEIVQYIRGIPVSQHFEDACGR